MKYKNILLLPIFAMVLPLSSCQKSDNGIKYDEIEAKILDDNYRTYYQIFPVSFADSNGNGRGDIQGIIDKLDYIENLNYTGIWLNPIHPSETAHHYDVIDYKDVDSDFGGMTALDKLITECHKRNIKIILDLVINHSSKKNVWFTNSYATAKAGKTTNQYYSYYNWIECTGSAPTGYHKVNGNDKIAYEGRFDSSMPDLNLQSVLDDNNGYLATELKDIFKFWLVDHNVDGFRLDAVTSYFTGEPEKNLAFMTWMNTECKTLKPNCYIVGEGNWSSNSLENKEYQTSGIDSFFQFANSIKNSGFIQNVIIQQMATYYQRALERNRENANGGIEAPFLDNHDVPRYVGGVNGRSNANNAKFAMGLLSLLGGATFTYYGDEIGMASQVTNADGFYRLPVRWGEGDEHTCKLARMNIYGVPNDSAVNDELSYPHPDVKTQLEDNDSIVNYVAKANLLRKQFPEIARGDSEQVLSDISSFTVTKRTYNGSSIFIALNASYVESYEIDIAEYGEKAVAELCTKGKVTYKKSGSSVVIVPPQSVLIIK